jgi:hypothetical protein
MPETSGPRNAAPHTSHSTAIVLSTLSPQSLQFVTMAPSQFGHASGGSTTPGK